MKRHVCLWSLCIAMLALVALALAACAGGNNAPVLTQGGGYTPLGGVQKNNQPTPSDFSDLQAAENGTLGQPVLVEFYADY